MRKINVSKAIAFTLIPVILYLSYIAGSWGLADVYYRPVKNTLERWKRQEQKLEDKDWDRLEAKLAKALALDPSNPDINHAYGTALEGRYILLSPGDDIAQAAREEAAKYYRIAIRQRPSWPYTWADFALAKYRLNELDNEFYHAMHTAMEIGPWEPGVQRVISFIGLQIWDVLREEERLFMLDTIKSALSHANKRHVKGMLKMLERNNFLETVCAAAKDDELVTQYCKANS